MAFLFLQCLLCRRNLGPLHMHCSSYAGPARHTPGSFIMRRARSSCAGSTAYKVIGWAAVKPKTGNAQRNVLIFRADCLIRGLCGRNLFKEVFKPFYYGCGRDPKYLNRRFCSVVPSDISAFLPIFSVRRFFSVSRFAIFPGFPGLLVFRGCWFFGLLVFRVAGFSGC